MLEKTPYLQLSSSFCGKVRVSFIEKCCKDKWSKESIKTALGARGPRAGCLYLFHQLLVVPTFASKDMTIGVALLHVLGAHVVKKQSNQLNRGYRQTQLKRMVQPDLDYWLGSLGPFGATPATGEYN